MVRNGCRGDVELEQHAHKERGAGGVVVGRGTTYVRSRGAGRERERERGVTKELASLPYSTREVFKA